MAWISVAVSAASTGIKLLGAQASADAERDAVNRATAERTAASERAEALLDPYVKAGERQLPQLESLISDPNAQVDFIKSNPLYALLAKDAQDRLFNTTAARGKFQSGGTAAALQDRLLLTGSNLLNKNISQRQNLVNTGANAASRTAGIITDTGEDVADLSIQRGNVEAARANALSEGLAGGITDLYGVYASGGSKGVKI